MTDDRFIELLNLYIDRELPPDQVSEIEDALAASPARQRIYAQYCKIEVACRQVLADPSETPRADIAAVIAAARARGESKIVSFPSAPSAPVVVRRRSSWGWSTAAAALSAACVALLFNLRSQGVSSVADAGTDRPAPTLAAVPAVAGAPVGIDDSADPRLQSTDAGSYRTVLRLEPSGTALTALAANESDPFAWMRTLEFSPIRRVEAGSLEFHTAEPMPVRNLSAFAYPYPGLDDTPPLSATAAFQFQR